MERPEKKIRIKWSWKSVFLGHWPFLAFLLIFTGLTAFKLITSARPFYDWDESLYVQVGREMVQNNFFLSPIWQGRIWFDKPPLSSLIFGIVTLSVPIQPEISARLLVLFIVALILMLTYVLYFRVTKNSFITTLALLATAYSPIFLQRTQVVSLDIFLLLGWIGFFVFLERPLVSLCFLFLSIQSKSLLGFYPLGIYGIFLLFQFLTKKTTFTETVAKLKILALQGILLSSWYIVMLVLYKGSFWQAHIIESHFRRVTASIESHFGQRTFYIDLLREQLGWYLIPSVFGFLLIVVQWLRRKVSDTTLLLAMAFVPWFVFLNLTKTKISWYLYPTVPQFFFFAAYPLVLLRKYSKTLSITASIIMLLVFYTAIVKNSFFTTFYSGFDPHIQLSQTAQKTCNNLGVLVSSSTRNTFKTLSNLGLTITTTEWWGDHPSMVYYFQKPLFFFYSSESFKKELPKYQCASIYTDDVQLLKGTDYNIVASYSGMLLLKHD